MGTVRMLADYRDPVTLPEPVDNPALAIRGFVLALPIIAALWALIIAGIGLLVGWW